MNPISAGPATPETIQRLQADVPAAFAMLAGLQLDIFSHLASGARGPGDIALSLGVAPEPVSRLLHALVLCGLLEHNGSGFANTPEAATFLVRGLPGYIGGMHELLSQLWHADLQTAQSIRTGQPQALHDFAASPEDEMAAMLRGMHPNALASGRDLARLFDFSQCRSVVDIGGGSGGLAAALCQAHPGLRATLFDLPRIVALAVAILAATPGGAGVAFEAGDILAGPPNGLHDAVVMRALVQVLAPADAARAIANAALALRSGGTIHIVGGGILDDDRMGPRQAVFLNLTFLNLYRGGASYTHMQHADWLAAAGCGEVRRVTLPSGAGIVSAVRLG